MTAPVLAAFVCTWIALAAVIVVLLGLTRRVLPTLASFEESHPIPLLGGPKPGDRLPAIRLPDLHGEPIDIGLFTNEPFVLLFVSSQCRICDDVVQGLESAAVNGAPLPVRMLVVTEDVIARRLAGSPSVVALVDDERAALRAVDGPGIPFGIAVEAGGVVRATSHPQGPEDVFHLANLLKEAAAETST
jgi:hypothetical protein